MKKSRLVKDLSNATAADVNELRNALALQLNSELQRVFLDHRNIFHSGEHSSKDCVLCRSLRRNIMRSFGGAFR